MAVESDAIVAFFAAEVEDGTAEIEAMYRNLCQSTRTRQAAIPAEGSIAVAGNR